MTALPGSVTVAGLGLMGGSLVHALARRPEPPAITLVDADPQALRAAADAGLGNAAHTVLADAPPSDLLVLATPVAAIIDTLRHGELDRHNFVTDVGSVKLAPYQAALDGRVADRYVGSHPLCGDHRAGFAAARAELYVGCTVYVTSEAPAAARELVSALWQAVGANVVQLSAAAHDALVAWTSHLPQAVSSLLAATLAGSGAGARELGAGGRDTTRIAASDPALWIDILLHNRAAVLEALAQFDHNLHALQRALSAAAVDDLSALLAKARDWRSTAS